MTSLKLSAPLSASINFRIEKLGADGRALKRYKKRRNVIVNSGLDAIGAATADWKTATNNVAVGTGALVTKRASGATTITATAGALFANNGYFVAADVGRILLLDSGERYPITAYTDSQNVTSSNLTNAGPSPGTMHYTNISGLITETERSNTIAPGGNRTSTYDAVLKTWTHTVVLLTPVLAVPRVYSEIAWSWSSANGGPIFGCAPISPTASLGVGQRLRVTITMVLKPSPMTATAVNVGLAVGNMLTELTGSDCGRLTVNSVQLGTGSPALAGPSTSSSPNIGTTMNAGTVTFSGYVNGTYKRTLTFQFSDALGALNANSLRISTGSPSAGVISETRLLLTSTLVKTNNDRVDGTFEFSWDRELVN
jgi:hypothetical protein